MSDATCHFNQTFGYFNRREIRMLAQALGLPEQRIEERLNKLGVEKTIPTSKLLQLLDTCTFVADLDQVYNSQGGQYNSVVLAKALQLIDAHLFSFDDIHKIRLAFDIYEMNASRHGKNSLPLLLQTIKFCDYRISLLKLEQRLRHYRLNKSRVLHLCEYFDLLLMCHREDTKLKALSERAVDLLNPKPVDQQIMEELNRKYLRDERNWYFRESFFKDKLIESSVWPAKIAHQYQVDEATTSKTHLQRQLSASISSLKQSRAGSACSRQSHMPSAMSRPISSCSVRSLAPTPNENNPDSSEQSTQPVVVPETKPNEITDRIKQLRSESTLLAFKYAIRREDYMTELFPNGYPKPVLPSQPVKCPIRKSRTLLYLPRRRMLVK